MELFKEYDEDELNHLKKVELMILEDVIIFCNENNIRYYVFFGTAIGAVRHGGFIPWDDDIDIVMFREDYEKFLKLFSTKCSEKYEILSMNTTEDYVVSFAKISLKGTRMDYWWADTASFVQGIQIEIFPLDYVSKNSFKRKLYYYACTLFLHLQLNSNSLIKSESKFKQFIHSSLYHFSKFFKLNNFYRKKYYEILTMYNKRENKFVVDSSFQYGNLVFETEDFEPSETIKFENLQVKIPKNYDKILTQIYGDYMKLPPKNQRVNHAPINLDFGEY